MITTYYNKMENYIKILTFTLRNSLYLKSKGDKYGIFDKSISANIRS